MSPTVPPAAARVFLGAWLFSCLLYPLWLPASAGFGAALARFAALCLIGLAALLWLRPAAVKGWETGLPAEAEILPRDPVLWLTLAAAVLPRVSMLALPPAGIGDESVHMAFPALPFKLWARTLPLPHPVLAWGLAVLAWAGRGTLARAWAAATRALEERPAVFCLWALAAAAVWFALLMPLLAGFTANGYPSLPRDFLRFPPLAKWLRWTLYAFLGVSAPAGRLPELLFYAGAGISAYHTLLLSGSRGAARAAAALLWLLAPVSFFGLRGTQACGEVFFFALTVHFFALWLLRGAPLHWAALSLGIGFTYRYTLAALAPALLVCALAEARGRGKGLREVLEAGALAGLLIAPWLLALLVDSYRPYAPSAASSLAEKFLLPAQVLLKAATAPAAAALALLALVSLARVRGVLAGLLCLSFAAYYVFIAADDVGRWDYVDAVRLALPLCVPAVLLAAEGARVLLSRYPWTAWLFAAAGAGLLWHSGWGAAPGPESLSWRYSRETDYLPLGKIARSLDALPAGTRVLGVDCSRSLFTFYLRDPGALPWAEVRSAELASAEDALRRFEEAGADLLVYADGEPRVGFGPERRPGIAAKLGASALFETVEEAAEGRNRIVIARRRP